MARYGIIDRRPESSGKSLVNKQRWLRRNKAVVKKAVNDAMANGSIKDIGKDQEISIPTTNEPMFRPSRQGGRREYVLPGNKKHIKGDRIARPDDQGSGGPSAEGEGEDPFKFLLSGKEALELYLEDMELPPFMAKKLAESDEVVIQRAGYSPTGSPHNLSITQTMRKAMGRHMALGRPSISLINALEKEIARLEEIGGNEEKIAKLQADLAVQQVKIKDMTPDEIARKTRMVPYIDPMDARYRRFEEKPVPISQGVMFCLMDVSGSVDEHMKDLAKRFYALLYQFLKLKYKRVEVVFVRHTHLAKEVTEEEFFHSRESGGTVVSEGLNEVLKIVKDRFPPNEWNILLAQASDGDNMPMDQTKTEKAMTEILGIASYASYLEVGHGEQKDKSETSLWKLYEKIQAENFAMQIATKRKDIWRVFSKLFHKDNWAKTGPSRPGMKQAALAPQPD